MQAGNFVVTELDDKGELLEGEQQPGNAEAEKQALTVLQNLKRQQESGMCISEEPIGATWDEDWPDTLDEWNGFGVDLIPKGHRGPPWVCSLRTVDHGTLITEATCTYQPTGWMAIDRKSYQVINHISPRVRCTYQHQVPM